ncbi:hypothetical protein [Tepidimicrobium xylanilyticum]|uniref:hypothetical protein n=1 Tax=Tepidimicrobium xylanilyticum TaxID=1123352 RepID=UPI00295EAF7B|nr:hypothetical protein [Tepidimicrobium xylanilyticum]
MNSIILLELISIVSFIFALLIVVIPGLTIDNFIAIFFLFLLVSYMEALFKRKGKKYFYFNLFLLLPVIKYPSIENIAFLFIAAYYILYFVFQYSSEVSINFFRRDFQRKLKILFILMGLSGIMGRLQTSGKDFIPFMLIYFISTIILLRSLRHLEHSPNMNKINRTNLIFAISVFILYLVLGIERLKIFLYQLVRSIYFWFTEMLFNILYWPIVYLSYVVEKFIRYIISLLINHTVELPSEELETVVDFSEWVQKSPSFLPWLSRFLSTVLMIALILFIAYISYRLFKKKVAGKGKEEIAYREEREFINIVGGDKDKGKQFLFRPKGLKEQIRYYYRKALIKLYRKGVDIIPSDTSLEINVKAENDVDKKILKDVREIYIEARYGGTEIDKSKVDKMKRLYKKI